MKKQFILFLLPLLTLAVGCNQTEQPISIDTQPAKLPAKGGQTSFTFTTPDA